MKAAPLAPRRHLFVCTNERAAGDPLGPGCSAHGEAVYAALKERVAERGCVSQVWITRTHCLGLCPKHGAAVAVHPERGLFVDVERADVPALWHNTGCP